MEIREGRDMGEKKREGESMGVEKMGRERGGGG